MKVERFWEKPVRGDHARWTYLVSRKYRDNSDGRTYTVRGYGESIPEAQADLQCQMMRCNPTHTKTHQPIDVWTISR